MFPRVSSIEELKREYRRLVMIHHPDRGGSEDAMKRLNEEYETLFKALKLSGGDRERSHEVNDGFREIIISVASVPGVVVEVCGSWVWVSGDTRPVKDTIKEAGFKWAAKKRMWYWTPTPERKHRRRTMTMDWIRERYGSSRVRGEESAALA
ncbi:MAG: J domain-containing protein [Clostridia bacterium]|nr:J domain-containing protein [Clostridia bacterium]